MLQYIQQLCLTNIYIFKALHQENEHKSNLYQHNFLLWDYLNHMLNPLTKQTVVGQSCFCKSFLVGHGVGVNLTLDMDPYN